MKQQQTFTEKEMKRLKGIQENYVNIQSELGQLSVTKIRLQQQLENVIKFEENSKVKFRETQNQEKEFISDITEKYGEGQLDANTGLYTSEGLKKDKVKESTNSTEKNVENVKK